MSNNSLCQLIGGAATALILTISPALTSWSQAPAPAPTPKRPNVVMLMSDDTGWADLGAYLGGAALGHPTPNLDQNRQGRRAVHQLVWPGQLHRGPRIVHHRAHPDPFGAVGRRRSRRPERPRERDADDRRVLPEERLFHLLLRQMASGRRGEVLPDQSRLRRDERVRCLLSGCLRLQRYGSQRAPVVPER